MASSYVRQATDPMTAESAAQVGNGSPGEGFEVRPLDDLHDRGEVILFEDEEG